MNRKERLQNAQFLQMAGHELEQGEYIAAREAIYDVVMQLHGSQFDREANTLLGAARHARFRNQEQALEYIGEVYDVLVDGKSIPIEKVGL